MFSEKSSMLQWLCLTVILISPNTFCTEEEVREYGPDDYFNNNCVLPMEEESKPDPRCSRFRWTNDDKIIGGEIADLVSSPWVASIQDLNFDYPIHFCGAIIINNFFLLTAAYCVYDYSEPYDKIKVVVGEYNLLIIDGWEVDLTIKNVIIHPDYDKDFFRYDVAIIEVKEEMHFNKWIRPIHLPHHQQSNIYKHMDTAKIYGWGKTLFTENPVDILRKATIPLISFEDCQHTAYGDIISPPTMCAGDLIHGGVASCAGDWGGPLVGKLYKHDLYGGTGSGDKLNTNYEEVYNGLEETLPFLLGVASASIGCGEPDTPNFYVDVRQILDWIHDNTCHSHDITNPQITN